VKVVDIITYPLKSVLKEKMYFAEGEVGSRNSLIVEIVTDSGISGWGESFCHGAQSPFLAEPVINTTLKPLIIGEDPFNVGVLWEKMYFATQPYGRKGVAISAISGIDVALWDCIGRALKKPIYELLGGAYRKDVQPYASGFLRKDGRAYPEAYVEEAREYAAAGYKGMKMKSGYGVRDDTKSITSVRECIGDDIDLMVDTNCAYNVASAKRLLKDIEDLNILWLEEPLPPDDIEGYMELKNFSSTNIASGENEFTKFGFRPWISQRAVDILQPDLCFAGGFTECAKILSMAEAWHISVMPHSWGSGVALAATMNFLAITPPCPSTFMPSEPLVEYDLSTHPFREELTHPRISLSGGRVPIPSGPGIGVEVDKERLMFYKSKM
jgi:D-galactarolactone cycloisomerase